MSGMDMGSGSSSSMTMSSFLHFTPLGDTLWFQGWTPSSPGAMVGACIGLFLLAIFDRWLAAGRATAEKAWRERWVRTLCFCSFRLSRVWGHPHRRRNTDFLPLIFTSAQLAAMARLDLSKESVDQKLVAHPPVLKALSLRGGLHVPPFNLSQDLARGALHTIQTALTYVLMLAVMYVSQSCLP